MRCRPRRAHLGGLPALLLLLGAAGEARAVTEEEWLVAASAGYASVAADGHRLSGGLLGAELAYGLDDTWMVRAGLEASLHRGSGDVDGRSGLVRATSFSLGVTYAVDVLRLVPFVDLGIAALDVRGAAADARADLGLQVGLGAEYLLTRRWALAFVVRYEHLPLRLAGVTPQFEGTPALFSTALRLGRIF